MVRVRACLAACLLWCLSLAAAAATSPPFHLDVRVIEAGAGLHDLVPTGFNNLGQVVGHASRQDGSRAVFLYEGGQMRELAALSAIGATVADINNVGQIVGQAGNRAFLYGAGTVSYFHDSDYRASAALGINDAGVATGWAQQGDVHSRQTVRFEHGSVIDAGTFDDPDMGGPYQYGSTYGIDINERGDIIGDGAHDSGYSLGFILYANGNLAIPHLDSIRYAELLDINNAGDAVGIGDTLDAGPHALLFRNGVSYDLTPGLEGGSHANAINNVGQILGGLTLWDSDGTPYSLNDLLPDDSPWMTAIGADLLNDSGQIVGRVCTGEYTGCVWALLTPVPEPSGVAMLSGGMLALGVLGLRRRLKLPARLRPA